MSQCTDRIQAIKLERCPCGAEARWFKAGRDVGIECTDETCRFNAQTDVYEPENADACAGRWNDRGPDQWMDQDEIARLRAQLAEAEEFLRKVNDLNVSVQIEINEFLARARSEPRLRKQERSTNL